MGWLDWGCFPLVWVLLWPSFPSMAIVAAAPNAGRVAIRGSDRLGCFTSRGLSCRDSAARTGDRSLRAEAGASGPQKASSLWERLGRPQTVAAPMVQQSELAYRLLLRQYGVQLAYTPMMHGRNFARTVEYRRDNFDALLVEDSTRGELYTPRSAYRRVEDERALLSPCRLSERDAPLIAQFAGNDPEVLCNAALHIQHLVSAIDLNLGCPQKIAKRGNYGAYLLENGALVHRIINSLTRRLQVPVTAKIRVLPREEDTLALAKMLEEAGCQLLTVHGRTKEQNKQTVGECDWGMIARIKESLSIPVISNGGIESYEDYVQCLKETGCDGVMSSEALLENPALFQGPLGPSDLEAEAVVKRQINFARKYLELAKIYYPTAGTCSIKSHLFKLLYRLLEVPENHDLRNILGEKGRELNEMEEVVEDLARRYESGLLPVLPVTWYRRHRKRTVST